MQIYVTSIFLPAATTRSLERELEPLRAIVEHQGKVGRAVLSEARKIGAGNLQIQKYLQLLKEDINLLIPESNTLPAPDNLPMLPLKSIDEVNELELLLKDSDDNKQALIKKLSLIGGSRFTSVIHETMKGVFTKNAATQFSLLGKKHKKSFMELELYGCVISE